jgi:DNA-binding MarR family transcriptional regulator
MDDRTTIPLDAETKVSERPADHEAELRLWLRLLTCTTLIEGEVRRRLRDNFDVTLPRFDLLAQLDKAPNGMTLGELSQRMMVSNGNVTGLAERLVEQGLLDRRASVSDRRAQIVSLTAEGRRVFRTMARTHEDWIAEIFSGLSASEVDTLMALLAKTKASARKAVTAREAP